MARRNKKLSRGGGIFFGIIWTAFSSIFVFFGLKLAYDSYHRSTWPEATCELTHFDVKSDPKHDDAFRPHVLYNYRWEQKSYTGDQVWANKKGVEEYEELTELIEQHRTGKLKQCHVNPDNPEEAVLIAQSGDIWGGLAFATFGGFFVAIGIAILCSSIWGKNSKDAPLSSRKSNDDAPKGFLIPFFSLFAIAGLGILFFVIVPQGKKYFAAKSWQETPATVIWSRVKTHQGDDSTTYSVDIFYRYQFSGKKYKSNTTDLFSSSSSGRSSKQEKVNAHPRGKQITCFVNPQNPSQALLERDLGWSALFVLFPLPFIGIGLGGLWWILRKRSSAKQALSSRDSSRALGRKSGQLSHLAGEADIYHRADHSAPSAEKSFSPGGGRIKKLLGVLLFAVFWNGIVSVFLTIATKSWLSGNPEWFLTLFLIPFVIIGLGAVGFCFYTLLALFNPAPKLTITPGELTLGDHCDISWKISSRAQRLNQFSIYLIGEEEATYRRGTNTVTDTQIFHEQLLFETSDPRQATRGSTTFSLPTNTMPSWKSKNNQIEWSLIVQGDISLWPDIKDSYKLKVFAPNFNH